MDIIIIVVFTNNVFERCFHQLFSLDQIADFLIFFNSKLSREVTTAKLLALVDS